MNELGGLRIWDVEVSMELALVRAPEETEARGLHYHRLEHWNEFERSH